MTVTPATLTRHELAGLPVQVAGATCESRVGLTGVVRRETAGTLRLGTAAGVRQVPKAGTTFRFALTDEAAGGRRSPGATSELPFDTAGMAAESPGQSDGSVPVGAATRPGESQDVVYVTVDGARLVGRPAERTEQEADSLWR
ncbi:MAG: ribonuclease P protein component 1 [Halobacteriaceae archaeon]